jgi:nucleoside-diphosphate-sugar epimerase
LEPYGLKADARVAVTGASGFVGGHLVEHLLSQGLSVLQLSRSRTAAAQRDHAESLVVRGYSDVQALSQALLGSEYLVHLAARAHRLRDDAGTSEAEFRTANVEGVRAVAESARLAGIKRLVLISSIGVHGSRTSGLPFSADSPPRPSELYAISKWQGEQAAVEVLAGSATELVILRPPLVYGRGCPGNFRLLMNLVRRLPWVPLGGLHRKRSMISVGNLCHAITLACVHPGAAGGRFVLADGDDVSVAEIARELALGFGRNPACVIPVPEHVLRSVATLLGRGAAIAKLADELIVDASAFRSATGWQPLQSAREALQATARDEVTTRSRAESAASA